METVPRMQHQVVAGKALEVGTKTGSMDTSMLTHDSALEDTFWQHIVEDDSMSNGELTDEAEADAARAMEEMTRISSQEFRFYHDGQRLKEDAANQFQEQAATMPTSPTLSSGNNQPHTYLSFSPQGSDDDSYLGGCSAIVVLTDCEEEDSSDSSNTSSSQSTLPTRPPPDEEKTPVQRKSSNSGRSTRSRSKSRVRKHSKIVITTSTSNIAPQGDTKPNTSKGGSRSSSSGKSSSKSRNNKSSKRTISGGGTSNNKPKTKSAGRRRRFLQSNQNKIKSIGSNVSKSTASTYHTTRSKGESARYKGDASASDRTKSTVSSTSVRSSSNRTGQTTLSSKATATKQAPSKASRQTSSSSPEKSNSRQLARRMPRHMDSSCFADDATLQSTATTVVLCKLEEQCGSLWAPVFYDIWENLDAPLGVKERGVDDEATLETYEDTISYEDEGHMNVLVAIQATVIGTDFPEALEAPKNDVQRIWGNNFVGVVQPPKGSNTCHSRRFPPGARVASISAWSAAAHKPYIPCNSSHLLPVPGHGGLHLDGTEVSVIVAAYLPAFQALHHGQRQHRNWAYEQTAFEGQRILILSHGHNKSSTHQSLVDARVQAAVKLALWAGARDVHVTVAKAGNSMRNFFGNDYRVRLLDTPPADWTPMLSQRIDLVLDFTPEGFSFDRKESTLQIVEEVMAEKGRYVGFLGEDCSSHAMDCREEGPVDQKKVSAWKEGLSFLQGKTSFLPEARDIKHTVQWTTICMKLKRASLFDFIYQWKQDRRLAERDFSFLLELLNKRQIRPQIAKLLDVCDFPSVTESQELRTSRSMGGALVCEPWSQVKDLDNLSCCSDVSY